MAVSTFSMRLDQGFDDAARRGIQQRDAGAGSRGVSGGAHLRKIAIGIIPRMVAYLTSIWLPKAPPRRMRST